MSIQSGRCIQHINNELNFGKCTTNNTAFICNISKDIQNKRIVHGIDLNVYVRTDAQARVYRILTTKQTNNINIAYEI